MTCGGHKGVAWNVAPPAAPPSPVPLRVLASRAFFGATRSAVVALVLCLCACGPGDESGGAAPPGGAGGGAGAGGSGPVRPCAEGHVELDDGSCRAPGVPATACAPGFEPDGADGCRALLPADDCPTAKLALPGETECRDIAPCGDGDYPSVEGEGGVLYVKADYQDGASDGSIDRPFTDIMAAILAAGPGQSVAIAAGTYAKTLIVSKPLTLYGRCPALVQIAGDNPAGAVTLFPGAAGTRLRGLGISGVGRGVNLVETTTDVELQDVWIHDTGKPALYLSANSAARASNVLIERAGGAAVFVWGAKAELERVALRDGAPDKEYGPFGRAVFARGHDGELSDASVVLRASLLERNLGESVLVDGAAADIDATLIRQIAVEPTLPDSGRALTASAGTDGTPAVVGLRRSVIQDNVNGIALFGAEATIEDTTIRDTGVGSQSALQGRGINIEPEKELPSSLTLRRSSIERSRGAALFVAGSQAVLESVRLRQVAPENVVGLGRGISLQPTGQAGCTIAVRDSIIEDTYEAGFLAYGTAAELDNVAIMDTKKRLDGAFGDGIAAIAVPAIASSMSVSRSRVEQSARAGIALFGVNLSLSETTLSCNPIQLNVELMDVAQAIDNGGGNRCECHGVPEQCRALSSNLEPPAPL
ncbi:MAG: DUF1565 domain-containing protein [Deltaproteobacteria bacterium]|nr:DUF1565 domain-containing protein [Deltaproteobacteria bacterium]